MPPFVEKKNMNANFQQQVNRDNQDNNENPVDNQQASDIARNIVEIFSQVDRVLQYRQENNLPLGGPIEVVVPRGITLMSVSFVDD